LKGLLKNVKTQCCFIISNYLLANKQESENENLSLGASTSLVLLEDTFLYLCPSCHLRKIFF